ncbi:MAG TPA: SRPBCC family protein, partial [Nocardioides sp.]|uniref:SRPBCC family protein n=1 Tax=Nocardioides sp. TaxID=35761 RepID=UPI002D7E3222
MSDKSTGGLKGLMDELPVDRLKDELRSGLTTLGGKAVESAGQRLTDLTDRLSDVADGGGVVGKAAKKGAEEAAEGGSPVKGALKGGLSGAKDKVKEKLGGGGGGGGKGTKSTNIIEEIDVGVPVSVAYNAWTEFQEWSGFMKKVDNIEQEDDTKLNFKAQVFWSHRRWEAQILEQVPDEKIVWRSKGEKGHVDGAVTFHEIGPNLTRILVVLEYYPQGLFERTGNLWRAQGRRARLELKHFRRHVMTEVIQNPDDVEGWRGEISDGEVERDHDEVVEEEQQQADEAEGEEDESAEEEPEDEYTEDEEYDESEEEPEEEPEDESEEEEPEDEYAEEEEPEEDDSEEESDEEEPE